MTVNRTRIQGYRTRIVERSGSSTAGRERERDVLKRNVLMDLEAVGSRSILQRPEPCQAGTAGLDCRSGTTGTTGSQADRSGWGILESCFKDGHIT